MTVSFPYDTFPWANCSSFLVGEAIQIGFTQTSGMGIQPT